MPNHAPDRESDESLVGRLQRGEEAALGALYDRYGGRVYSVAKHILQDAGAADQVLQDIFHQLCSDAGRFHSAHGSLVGWLLMTARNRSIERRRGRAPAAAPEGAAILRSSGLDVESAAALNQIAERVRAALEALPEAQREAMELAYFQGLTQSEIAQRTGDPLATVKTRLTTALASLQAELGD
jgi:RNA polymerase sigma-70 factor, ECF subfamily